MNTQPEALRLADVLDDEEFNMSSKDIFDAAAELRRLHKENQMLAEAVERLMSKEGDRKLYLQKIEAALAKAKEQA